MPEPTPKPDQATPFDDGALYDVVFEGFDYGLEFYLGLARAARGPVLDVACGTGRVLLPCLQAGVETEGLDFFPGMLTRLREKANALGLNPKLHQADMASFHLHRRFALIMIPFNAFGHNLTTDQQLGCLKCCLEHLLPGGLLAIDAFFPGLAFINGPQGERVLELERPHPKTGLPIRQFDTRSYDRVKQQQHSIVEIEFLDQSGNVTSVRRSETTISWIYKKEMDLLLRLAGFARWQIAGGFDGHPLEAETDGMIVQAWAAGG